MVDDCSLVKLQTNNGNNSKEQQETKQQTKNGHRGGPAKAAVEKKITVNIVVCVLEGM